MKVERATLAIYSKVMIQTHSQNHKLLSPKDERMPYHNLSFFYLSSAIFQLRSPLLILAALSLLGCASEMSRGSSKALYTIADTLEVHRNDIGKEIQLHRDQKLFFNFSKNPDEPGSWKLVDYSKRTLLLLSETPRVSPGDWGLLLQARALGSGEVELLFTPDDEALPSCNIKFETSISR